MMNNKDYEIHEIIMKQLCKEVEQIADSIQKNQSMSSQELEKLDKFYHLKKSMLTVQAMEEAGDYEDNESFNESRQNGNSGYRGRAANGRYVSRDSADSYAEGYSKGYSEAMNQMNNGSNSGHYPMMPYSPRRW